VQLAHLSAWNFFALPTEVGATNQAPQACFAGGKLCGLNDYLITCAIIRLSLQERQITTNQIIPFLSARQLRQKFCTLIALPVKHEIRIRSTFYPYDTGFVK
jgi:hypothetical protein